MCEHATCGIASQESRWPFHACGSVQIDAITEIYRILRVEVPVYQQVALLLEIHLSESNAWYWKWFSRVE